ncbi:MAG: sulfatase-like hydrolase/transferase [Planctomycetales bacterium]|nr:sulfatase-like hydrolase/transferase [Planctomycetales bacterium]
MIKTLRGYHLVILFWGLGNAFVAPAGAWADDAVPTRPNVLLILSDDQAWTDFGFMGHQHIETPRIDRLASESLTFTRGYVPSSLCRPSLATIITGLYPHQHKITSNDPALPQGPRFRQDQQLLINHIDRVATLPKLLGKHGYLSLQTGKWWEGHYRRGGFTHGMTHGDPERGGRHGDEGLKIGREGMAPIREFLDATQGKPFLLWYAPFLPHRPHTPPDRLVEKYQKQTDSPHVARYWASCEWFDETCGELLDELERRDLDQNTIVVFVVDNGWIQRPDDPGYAERSKRSPYDGGLRTPLMIRWPGHVTPARSEIPVSTIDIAPTLWKACDLTPPADSLGINLLSSAEVSARHSVMGEVFLHNARDINNPLANLTYRWIVSEPWKLIVPYPDNVPDGGPELYQLQKDPYETTDRSKMETDVVAELRGQLDRWWPTSKPDDPR